MKLMNIGFVIITFLAINIYGQSAYLDDGQSGFKFDAGISTSENINGINGAVGFSSSGVLDFGLSISRLKSDEYYYEYGELKAISLSPVIRYLPLKQNDKTPLSLSVEARYNYISYSGSVLSDNNLKMTGNYYSLGGELFGLFKISNFKIKPTIGALYSEGSITLKDNEENEISSDDVSTQIILGGALVFDSSSNIIAVHTNVISDGNIVIYNLGFSYILSND